ncbi:MAG: xanthine dehydrogenase family protein subunit M [Acidobacteria bacterium]|nr:xanthine dehydrogenase family protein subunit M [Acidobacteriota bacterium]
MIPQSFDYSAPATLKEALAQVSSGAKPLAGGMSLVPIMKLRLAAPEQLVDLGRIPELNYIRKEGSELRIGAMTTHYQIESSPLVRADCALLGETAGRIGDVQVRNVGTIGGSVAHADPAADYPAALLALGASLKLVSTGGERVLAAAQFFLDTFTTALDPGELIAEVRVPVSSGAGTAYVKLAQPASGFALVGIAARLVRAGNRIGSAAIGVTGVGPKAYRASEVERLLAAGKPTREAALHITGGIDVNSDLHASAEYRRHLASVYAARAIELAWSRTE